MPRNHYPKLAESLGLRHARLSQPVARDRRLGTAPTLYGCMEWPSLVGISIPPPSMGEGWVGVWLPHVLDDYGVHALGIFQDFIIPKA